MNGNIRVGNLFGIPFYVNISWFLVLGLVTFSYGSALAAQFPAIGGVLPWLLGFVAALLLFSSVLAHELGHSFVAKSQGIEVKSITLFLFGGLASLERESKTPAEAFWVAIAAFSKFDLFGIFTGIGLGTGLTGPLSVVIGLLASINLMLALFNLIPGLPLDGGNILKAAVWKVTGNPFKGVVFASRVGQVLGWIAIASGFFGEFLECFNWILLLQNAGRSAQYATVQNALAGLKAVDAVTPNSPIVPVEISLREFANQYIIGNENSWRQFFGVNDLGQVLGVVTVADLNAIPTSDWPRMTVKDVMKPVDLPVAVKPEDSLLDVVNLLEQRQLFEVPVIQENGVIVGLIEKAKIIRLLEQSAQGKAA